MNGFATIIKGTAAIACLAGASLGIASSPDLRTGIVTSGGGEIMNYQYNPWVLGDAAASYCVLKSENYSQSMEKALKEVNAAFSDWQETLRLLDQSQTLFRLGDGKRKKISTDFVFHKECSPDTDVTVYLGGKPFPIFKESRIEGRYVSIAMQTQFNEETGNAKGVIWLNDDLGNDSYLQSNKAYWDKGTYTYHVMLHEIAHVVGVHHYDDKWFLNSDFPHQLVLDALSDGRLGDRLRRNPESSRFLARHNMIKDGGKYCKLAGSYSGTTTNGVNALTILFPGINPEQLRKDKARICFDFNDDPYEGLEIKITDSEQSTDLYKVRAKFSAGGQSTNFHLSGNYLAFLPDGSSKKTEHAFYHFFDIVGQGHLIDRPDVWIRISNPRQNIRITVTGKDKFYELDY